MGYRLTSAPRPASAAAAAAAAATAVAFTLVVATPAGAGVIVPFTEDFDADAANWYDSAGASIVDWVSAGGPDGGSYVTTTDLIPDPVPEFGFNFFRAQDELDSSGGAFVGDWETSGVTAISFFLRHDAPLPIDVFARVAGPANFPGVAALSFVPVRPNVWTEVSIPVLEGGPNLIFEGPFGYSDVFGDVGHVQIGATLDGALAGTSISVDLDKVTIIPGPGALAALVAAGLVGSRRRRRRRRRYSDA